MPPKRSGSAATRSTASSTSTASTSAAPRANERGGPAEGRAPDLALRRARGRFAWCLTGSGHYLDESLAIARALPPCDLFLSAAGEEVLEIYKIRIEQLKPQFRVFRDKSASGVPVGRLYSDWYHTLVVAPATSNTVAKCALGISDTLPTNMFAQAGKVGVPCIVFACDTEPVVITKSPKEWVELRPRRIELDNVERLRAIDHCQVVTTPAELHAALDARLAALGQTWQQPANTFSS